MAEALIETAAELSGTVLGAVGKRQLNASDAASFRVSYDIATRLYLISKYLASIPPYWIDGEVENLCGWVLKDLQDITRPSKESATSTFWWRRAGPDHNDNLETCLMTYCKTKITEAEKLKNLCDELVGLLEDESNPQTIPDAPHSNFEIPHAASAGFESGMYEALQAITECDMSFHETTGAVQIVGQGSNPLRHPARLCLHEVMPRGMSILISSTNMAMWQEFVLNTQTVTAEHETQRFLARGGLCHVLDSDYTACLFLSFEQERGLRMLNTSQPLRQIPDAGHGVSLAHVLDNYKLTAKDKVVFAYAIAMSYWKYYDSELMRTRWTSDTIWLMPEEEESDRQDRLPFCGYLSFPFDVTNEPSPDILLKNYLNHRCPRIFDIGVLLLEIGLAKPFRAGNRRDVVAQANNSHRLANKQYLELEKQDWEGFSDNKQIGISTRQAIFKKNVVRPLAWLAHRGFGADAGTITYIKKKPASIAEEGDGNNMRQETEEASFHGSDEPQKWLDNLKKISGLLERKRRASTLNTSVRVAILDTGLNTSLLKSTESIIESKDFVAPEATEMTDSFGHGTYMARLVTECAPGAQIIVARVAENTNQLKRRQNEIKDAILWAGKSVKADIISMSFGFDRDDEDILEAIEEVKRDRKGEVIFLASSGNSPTDDESFPARQESVIAVYSTSCQGKFLDSNPRSTTNRANILGTYGDDVPEAINAEFREVYGNVCGPGTSIATAVMAAICTNMLVYSLVLPSFLGALASSATRTLKLVRTARGMEAILYRMAPEDLERPRLRAVQPTWFWKTKGDDLSRFCAMNDTLSAISRRRP